MPNDFDRQYDETEKCPVTQRDQREVTLGETYSNEALPFVTLGLVCIQSDVFANFEPGFFQQKSSRKTK